MAKTTTHDTVKDLLTKFPHLADDDNKLVTVFWINQLKVQGFDVNESSATELLYTFSKGNLTKPDIVTRARRKVEEHNPSLRGKTWDARQGAGKVITSDHIANY